MPEFEQSEGFKLKSGNRTDFKNMGSSPAKQRKFSSYDDSGRKITHGWTNPTKDFPTEANHGLTKSEIEENKRKEKLKKSKKKIDYAKSQLTPAKQTDNTYSDGTKKSAREVEFSKRHTAEETKDKYWYKVDGKKVNYSQYKAAKEKGVANPNSTNFTDGPGLQTNHPDPWGYKAKREKDRKDNQRKPKKQ